MTARGFPPRLHGIGEEVPASNALERAKGGWANEKISVDRRVAVGNHLAAGRIAGFGLHL